MNFQGETAIIPGGARDIGKAISLELAKEGAYVVVNYFHSKTNAEETLKEIHSNGGEGIMVKGDMSKKEDVDHLIMEATHKYGRSIDILVNNAGSLVAEKLWMK